MRVCLILLFVCVFSVFATDSDAQNAIIRLSSNQLNLAQLFDEIEKQTDYLIVYSTSEVNTNQTVAFSGTSGSISNYLREALSDNELNYEYENNYIILSKKSILSNTQQTGKHITGTVTDADGEPIIGANITEKGISNGTVTDVDGNFSLTVKDDAVLQISYIGYVAQEISVLPLAEGRGIPLLIKLMEDLQTLEEVVVVGYGIQKKVSVTGAVSTISSKVIENRPIRSAIEAMQGTVPGLTVQSASGEPGKYASLKIRGNTSVNSDGALVLIDGLPGNISMVNPSDIESVSVLKDAASAAIYGARAAEGVILVTTRTGQSEKLKIEYTGNFSYNTPTRIPQLTTGLEHMEMANAAFALAKMSAPYPEAALEARRTNSAGSIPNGAAWIFTGDTDWIGKFMDHNTQQNHNITLSKASSGLKYLFSAGWLEQDGFFSKYADDNYDRINIRSNINVNIAKNLSLDTKISFISSTRNYMPTVQGEWSIPYILFVQMGSVMPIYDENGHYARYRRQSNLMQQINEGGEAYDKGQRADGVATFDWTPLDGLKFSLLGGVTLSNDRQKIFKRTVERWGPLGLLEVAVGQGNPSAIAQSVSNTTYYIGQFTTDYKKSFNKHDLSFLGGVSFEQNDYESLEGSRDDILANILPSLNLGTSNINNSAPANQWVLFSLFARFNYAYASKYLFEAQVREDASSRFSKRNRWGVFPSVSVGWRITEENFMKQQKVFSNLKLRASWGQMGNQSGLGFYDHIAQYAVGGYYPFGSEPKAQWAQDSRLPSEDRTWETIEVQNIAVETGFLKNRLNSTFEYFTKRNKDMLMSVTVPSVIGIEVPTGNYGELFTKGWELSVSWNDRVDKVSYNIGFNISDQIDKLVKYSNTNISATYGGPGDGSGTTDVYTQGYSMGAYFGYKTAGYFQTTEEAASYPHINANPNVTAGDIKYLDINGDKEVNAPGDLAYIGNRIPRYILGLNLGLQWRGWNLSALFQGVGKRDFYLSSNAVAPFVFEYGNISFQHHKDSWTPENPDALLPRHIVGATYNYQSSDHWIQDASYIRLKNLQLGYSVDEKLIKSIGLNRLRIFFSGENLFEITKMLKAYDPELNITGGYMYPIMRNFSIGVNLTF
ncbi:MAG: TonB-dependent receptor [Dysgonamonadaceae bacterium]|nr:TonB-dependent receptor [Dysgonamonadaceae bacterium]